MLLGLIVKRGPCTASSIIRDFNRVVLEAEGSDNQPKNSRRVWPTINELKADWGIVLVIKLGRRAQSGCLARTPT